MIAWKEWQASREATRNAMRKYGVDAPSRRKTSFNTAERHMVKAFGGSRIPTWAKAADAATGKGGI